MAGTRKGGLKAAATNRAKYGEDFYKEIGHKGGSAWSDKLKGFAANPELAKKVGREIGRKTKRGFKWLGDFGSNRGRYRNLETGKVTIMKYSKKQ